MGILNGSSGGGVGETLVMTRERMRQLWYRISRCCCNLLSKKSMYILILCNGILFFLTFVLYLGGYLQETFFVLSYVSRPLWDHPPENFEVIPHYYAEGVPMSTLCQLHEWTYKGDNRTNKVVDAVIFANELDLLEIRLRELYPVVDLFFIVESAKTFTDKPKPLAFMENKERFRFAEDKIVYGEFKAPPVTEEQAMGFTLETMLRDFMSNLLRSRGVVNDDIVIMADVDEIPSRHTIELFKHCDGFPDVLHLGMKNYLYSFEFPITHQAGYLTDASPNSYQWRPQIHRWSNGAYYRHGRSTATMLADSGWHCSFCFRYIKDFTFKMTAYSHSDRVRSADFLDPARVQRIACEGTDIFDMPSESFTFFDLLLNWYPPVKTQAAVHLPRPVLEDAEKFAFLLPGNCIREDS
jgi:beta-1,4-mannosyl-glycoprotein beta-1,4-N-acetylglucosaminyltransferase